MKAGFDDVADSYDEDTAALYRPEVLGPTVDLLAELADGGAALELGIGTGRVALPLRDRVERLHGVDCSRAMLDQLRKKPGAERIGLTLGDFAHTRVPGHFRLVYLVYNVITNLITQDEQVACFRNAAEHLEPGGRLVIEVFVPALQRLPPGERARVFDLSSDHVGFDEYTDLVAQILHSHHYWSEASGRPRFRSTHRYVWPSELDLMAQLAGLRRLHRFASWARDPFVDASPAHVSVWERPAS